MLLTLYKTNVDSIHGLYQAECLCKCFNQESLRKSRNTNEQTMSAREERNEKMFDDCVLPNNHFADFCPQVCVHLCEPFYGLDIIGCFYFIATCSPKFRVVYTPQFRAGYRHKWFSSVHRSILHFVYCASYKVQAVECVLKSSCKLIACGAVRFRIQIIWKPYEEPTTVRSGSLISPALIS